MTIPMVKKQPLGLIVLPGRRRLNFFSMWLKKGDKIYVEGRLDIQEYEKDGLKSKRMRLNISDFELFNGATTESSIEILSKTTKTGGQSTI